jgi:predicted anti-sigma-YlaC factor YlaD
MKCTEIRELLPDLAAGLAAAKPEINEHLHSCVDCAGTFAEFRATMALLDEWQAPEPSSYFDIRLHARLREEAAKEQPAGWLAWLRRPALAISLAAALVVGATVFRLEQTKQHNSTPTVAAAEPGTAVGDLQALDKNQDVYADADSDLLDDLQVQQDVNANP